MTPPHMAAAVVVMAIWASNLVAARFALPELPGWLLITVRMAALALPLVPFVRFPRGHVGRIAALSVTMGTGHFGLMFVALEHIPASVAALTVQTAVPFAALVAWLLHREPLGWLRAAGIAAAFGGVALIVGGPGDTAAVSLKGTGLALASAFCFAVANVQLRGVGGVSVFAVNGWMAAFSLPQLVLLTLLFEDNQLAALANVSFPAVVAILHMSVVVSVAGHGLWYAIVPRYRTNQTMPMTLLIPVFGVALAVTILDEAFTLQLLAGGLVTIGGVALVMFCGERGRGARGRIA